MRSTMIDKPINTTVCVMSATRGGDGEGVRPPFLESMRDFLDVNRQL